MALAHEQMTEQGMAAGLVSPPVEPEIASEQTAEPDVEIIDHRASLRETLRETWQCRGLLPTVSWMLLSRVFVAYRLGPFWLMFGPIMGVVGYSLIFGGGVFDVQTPNGMPYFLFMMVGMMGYQLFQTSLVQSSRAFQRVGSLARGLHFPLVLIPIAGSALALFQFAILVLFYVGTTLFLWIAKGHFYAQLGPKYLALSMLGLFLCLLLAWGVGLWTAALMVRVRDIRQIIRYSLPFLMLVTPVLYPIEQLHGKTRLIAELNPLASAVEMAKVGLLGAGSVRVYAATWSVTAIVLIFFSGVWFIGRYGAAVAKLRDFEQEEE